MFKEPPMALIDPRLCACGSGLRQTRCCELDASSLAARDAARHLIPLIEQAQLALREQRTAAAESLCHEILELSPGQQDTLTLLYQICKNQGRTKAAEALVRRLVALNPNHLWATHELALMLMNNGNLGEAELHARNAVRIAPDNPQSHNLLGMILTEANRPRVGEYHYRRVLSLLEQPDPILLANLAWNLKNQGRMREARALYEQSVALAPHVLQTLLGWARLEEADRCFTACAKLLDQAEELAPGNQSVLLTRAVLHGRMHAPRKALAVLDRMARAPEGVPGSATLGPNELLEKGRLLDQVGSYKNAFAAFVEAKRLTREASGKTYMAEHAHALTSRLRSFFVGPRLATLPRATVERRGPQPIFIVGFPRSGTTLIEQTLSAHPHISAGDELPFIAEIADSMARLLNSPLNYPEALCELWFGDRRSELDNLREYYLQRVKQLAIQEPGVWFTDKMPLNETHLGLIGLLFPHAPIIHLLRHPLDVVLSVFSNQLTHGFFCASALESAAQHYVLIMDLVAHYRGEMLLRYLPIRYEDVVQDQEGSVRRMLDFIGEPFDPACLQFHENRRYARTASYAQVTEKLYDRSRYRYRNYLDQLAPVVPILAPIMQRLGYEVAA
jgi:Flp pilus assembly protein TadD